MSLRLRTLSELRGAVDSMFRIRAVESPPDAEGLRTIWHRGAKGADLLTEVDGLGKVVRQELSLFDDHLEWQRDGALRTGTVEAADGSAAAPASDDVRFDAPATGAALERLRRAQLGLGAYQGSDRYIQHVRELVTKALQGHPLGSETPVTGAIPGLLPEPTPDAEATTEQVERGDPRVTRLAIIAGIALVLAAIAWLVWGSPP